MNKRKILRDGLLHLKRQGVFSVNPDLWSICVYRAQDGRACIIGGIIDKHIMPKERLNVREVYNESVEIQENLQKKYGPFEIDDLDFLDYIQYSFHDSPSLRFTFTQDFFTSVEFQCAWDGLRRMYL